MKRRRALWLTLGTVLALCGVCGLWLDRQQRQYVRNRELIAALERDDTQTALALVSAGADPNTRYALPRASPFQALVSRLLRRSLPAPNASATAFQMACGPRVEKSGTITADLRLPREDIGLVEAMLAHGANVALLRRNDNSALHAAAGDGRLQTVALLLRHGAHVNARNLLGQTPLMLAASNRTPDVTRLLLAQGAEVATQDIVGRSPLYYAVKYGTGTGVVSELLAHGAVPSLRARNGNSPLTLAQQDKRADLVRLFQQHGAK